MNKAAALNDACNGVGYYPGGRVCDTLSQLTFAAIHLLRVTTPAALGSAAPAATVLSQWCSERRIFDFCVAVVPHV